MTTVRRPVPIYTTIGDFEAFMVYPMIFNRAGEWIGFVTPDRDVYSVYGNYVGWLSDDPRILRKKSYNFDKPKLKPPRPPSRIVAPASIPLPPMMAELSFDTFDVLQEDPDLMPTMDYGEFREDLD
jgi:hypothetical protein